ncbi:MAG TPA: hypothetical protein PLA12_10550 [Candidatus Hydrogenedens sp.]|nr:hypothetical protein [Candidatus Hydrogenedens sp.]
MSTKDVAIIGAENSNCNSPRNKTCIRQKDDIIEKYTQNILPVSIGR